MQTDYIDFFPEGKKGLFSAEELGFPISVTRVTQLTGLTAADLLPYGEAGRITTFERTASGFYRPLWPHECAKTPSFRDRMLDQDGTASNSDAVKRLSGLYFYQPEIVALNKDKEEIVTLKRAKLHAPHKSTVTTPKKPTKVAQRVLDLREAWRNYAKDKLKTNPSYPMAKAITQIKKMDIGLNLKGEEWHSDTIRDQIKDLFPGKPGRPTEK